jgi:hypothetical protein
MHVDKRHPQDCGFRLGVTVAVGPNGQALNTTWEPEAKSSRDLVYVARRLDGEFLKIGATSGTLYGRWRGILKLISAEREQRRYRDNEWEDRDRWRLHVSGHTFEVWFRSGLDSQSKLRSDISMEKRR